MCECTLNTLPDRGYTLTLMCKGESTIIGLACVLDAKHNLRKPDDDGIYTRKHNNFYVVGLPQVLRTPSARNKYINMCKN